MADSDTWGQSKNSDEFLTLTPDLRPGTELILSPRCVCIVRPDPIYPSSRTRVANVILTSPDCLAASITLITAW